MRYRLADHDRGDAARWEGDPVPIITCGDCPPPSTYNILPNSITLDDHNTMRLLRKPRALDWSPKNDYALLLLFKVPAL